MLRLVRIRRIPASGDNGIVHLELLKLSPAVAILLFLNIRQDRRNEKLVDALIDCFREFAS